MRKILLLLSVLSPLTLLYSQCWTTVSAGGAHTIAIRDGGAIFSWGRNNNGQLGLGTTGGQQNLPQQMGSDFNWQTISAGNAHNLAVKTNGTLWAWGRNSDGQIGIGSSAAMFNNPQQIGTATNWSKISAGDEYCIAIKTDGTLWAWGDNTYGQLGDNSIVDKNAPIQIGTATDWLQISAGTDHSLALKTNGTLWAWGRNNVGQFGAASPASSLIPIQIGTNTNWSKIFAAREHSIGIKTDNSYWVWGGNTNGQFGNGTTIPSSTPLSITAFDNSRQIAKGHQHSVVIKQDGTIWAAGGNTSGQLGNGNNTQQTSPVQENTFATNWSSISSKVSHTAGLKTDGRLFTWGANLFGQLGDNSSSPKNTPTEITCPTLNLMVFDNQEPLHIYPNPVENILHFNILDIEIFESIKISDMTGKIVYYKEALESEINTENLESGVYFIQVKADEKTYQAKFVKR